MSNESIVHGKVAPGFEAVREAFAENFSRRGDIGAGFCAYVDGIEVAWLWGGMARAGVPWSERTLTTTMSVSKGVVALVIQLLVERGLVDLDAPVARYWPAFGQNEKHAITLRMVLSHAAGIPWLPRAMRIVSTDDPASWQDQAVITRSLEEAPPVWRPGSRLGYHSITFGWILGEVCRRTTGKTIGTFLREEIAGPLDIDFWIGLPPSEHARVAPLIPDPALDAEPVRAFLNPDTPVGKAICVGPAKRLGTAIRESLNTPTMWSSEIPSMGGMGSARGVARLYSLLAQGGEQGGVRLLPPESVERHRAQQVAGRDVVWGDFRRVALGYALPVPHFPLGPSPEAFGHGGLGGAMGFADPVARVGFGYVPSRLLFSRGSDGRVEALADALYRCLG
jgi:CubicO group peptidase (beta-lactamase class C family)